MPATMLAFDDTDSPEGMCTTYLAALMLDELSDFDLIGLPRLVRLNPNIPWKTRGNAAICLPLGHGIGVGRVCGSLGSQQVRYYSTGRSVDQDELLVRAVRVLKRTARFDCAKTNPGIVASSNRISPGFYWRAVREVVPVADAEAALRSCCASFRKFKSGRGIIGAAAAMSWRPRDRTWEVISYRQPELFGTPRDVSPESVIAMDKSTKWTFNNYDYLNHHVAIVPASPCPILFGIRGDSPSELLRARTMIKGEPQDRWLLFLTNQATEDHLVPRSVSSLEPRDSAKLRVHVVSEPITIPGGHVIVRVTDGDEIDAAFYEPSRDFRDVARALIPGDKVELYGSVRLKPRSLNVEKMHVISLVVDERKVHNPTCRRCRKRMGSMGSGQGYRCKVCGAKAAKESAVFRTFPRKVKRGWYEPPVASRRHLHKPIRRMSRGNIDNL